jgi:hypothetical protein
MSINLSTLIDDAKCYQIVRQMRWSTECDALGVTVARWSRTVEMRLKVSDSATAAKPAGLTSMIESQRSLQASSAAAKVGWAVMY